jgi:hypothetical protein
MSKSLKHHVLLGGPSAEREVSLRSGARRCGRAADPWTQCHRGRSTASGLGFAVTTVDVVFLYSARDLR